MTEMSFCRQQIGIEPDVKAFRILIRAPKIKKTDSGFIIPDSVLEREMNAFNIGLILAVGPLAFTAEGAPYKAEIGQWVWYSNYERNPAYIPDYNCYYLNDDRVLAAVLPQDLERLLNAGVGKYE